MGQVSNKSIALGALLGVFREAGLSEGESVILHSSLRSLGPVEGGADTVLDALLGAIGAKGNLMLPTFNYTDPLPQPYYDPIETPCRTGIIPETGRRRRGAVRSLHPTHSVAVIGPNAGFLTAGHLDHRAFGKGSPVGRLAEMNGKVLLIGVDHRANSMVHVAEEYADIPKVPWWNAQRIGRVRMPDGKIVSHELDTSPSCSAAFGAVEARLRRHNEVRDGRAGKAMLQLVLARDVISRACEMIAEKADVLLCTWAQCNACSSTRQELRRLGRL